jgi:hypothetical protein
MTSNNIDVLYGNFKDALIDVLLGTRKAMLLTAHCGRLEPMP